MALAAALTTSSEAPLAGAVTSRTKGSETVVVSSDVVANGAVPETNGVGNGKANGSANGVSNGHVNGHTNGKANGSANGTTKIADDAHKVIEEDHRYRDFFWTYTEEPHRSRRLAIIKAHPEVTKLCGPEPLTKYVVTGVVILQLVVGYALRNSSFLDWKFWAAAYVIGATANQNLFMAIHEISHNLAFRSRTANRMFAILANLPIGIPYSASFRPYHLTHHKSLGVDGLDTDLPTALEAVVLDSILGKAFFCTFQIFFYALRPMAVMRIPMTWVHGVNVAVQGVFDVIYVYSFGWMPFMYLLMSSFLAGSLHPLAGHFIAEHYVTDIVTPEARDPANNIPIPETYSYYGPLNFLVYNVGYHNEHHDFPAVPWTKLAKVREVAPEFYNTLPHHLSWSLVLWRFIWDDNVGLNCRVKRKTGGRLVGGAKVAGWTEKEIQF